MTLRLRLFSYLVLRGSMYKCRGIIEPQESSRERPHIDGMSSIMSHSLTVLESDWV